MIISFLYADLSLNLRKNPKPLVMIYEFITPSDPITFIAESDKIAFFCSLILGNGKADMKRQDEKEIEESPLFLFHPDPLSIIEKYLESSIDDFGDSNADEISKCFESFAYTSLNGRPKYDAELSAITDGESLRLFKEKHEDENRSSMSRWVDVAWIYANVFNPKLQENP